MESVSNSKSCIKLLSWKNDKCLMIFLLISIILCVPIIILSNIISYDGEISMSISDELIKNFNTGYFKSFRKCSLPTNFNPSKQSNDNLISFGTWQGTVKGCGITKDKNIKEARILEEGETCKSNEEFLEAIPSMEIYSYKGIVICGETKGEYYDLLNDGSIVKQNEDCPEGKKSCGYIDTLKNKLCFDLNEDCPINYIRISDTKPNIENVQEIKGNNDISLFYSNNPYPDLSEIPFVQNTFKIAESVICSLPNLYYTKLSLFILDAFKKNIQLIVYHMIILIKVHVIIIDIINLIQLTIINYMKKIK